MPKVKVNDIEIYYEMHGKGASLVMIPGWGYSSEMWNPEFIGKLSKLYRVVLIDNRGTGRSSKPDIPYTIKMMADDIAGLMDAVKVPKAHVLGTSMGALIAQEFALNHPEKVMGLILCMATCGGPKSVPVPAKFAKAMFTTADPSLDTLNEEALELFWSLVYSPKYIKKHRDELLKGGVSVKYPTPIIGKKRQGEAVLNFDTYDRLPNIKAPTLIMAGENDVIVPVKNSKILAERIPNSKLLLFKNCSHGFLREKIDEVLSAMQDFLKEVK